MTLLGIPDSEFLRGDVPMTKEEVRILTMAKARIGAGAIVYDVGAGTGSLTVEAALQLEEMAASRPAEAGHVYAIERKDAAVQLIHANAEKFGVSSLVTVIASEAPEGMEDLPPCDAVLIGGSGSHLSEILALVDGKLRLGGRIVLNAITVQTIAAAISYFRAQKARYTYETIQMQVNRLRQIGPYDMAQAENPIYILTATKKETMM